MNVVPFLDPNADGALRMMMVHGETFSYLHKFDLTALGDMYVIWRNQKKVEELTIDENLPSDQKDKTLEKIEGFKNSVLNSPYIDTTIFAMRKDANSPIVITDGIHRAIGIQRALKEKPSVQGNINLRVLLFEGVNIHMLPDYALSIPNE